MPLNKNVRDCQHIKVTGVQCGSPAMRGEQFCYFHQRMLRGVKTPPNARLHPIAQIESEEAIQASLMEVINALARNHIDLRRASLILKALHIAVRNSRRARFGLNDSQMVREVPEYDAAPAPPPRPAPTEKEKEVPRLIAQDLKAQMQASALATVATTRIAATAGVDERKVSTRISSGENAKVGAPSLRTLQGWDPTTSTKGSIGVSLSITPDQTTPSTSGIAFADATQRKPPARASAPVAQKQAVNQTRSRT